MQYRIVLGGGVYYMGEVPRNTRRIGGGVMFRISSVGIWSDVGLSVEVFIGLVSHQWRMSCIYLASSNDVSEGVGDGDQWGLKCWGLSVSDANKLESGVL